MPPVPSAIDLTGSTSAPPTTQTSTQPPPPAPTGTLEGTDATEEYREGIRRQIIDRIEWDPRGGSSDTSRTERLEDIYNLVAETCALKTVPKLSKRQRDALDPVGQALYNAAGDVWPAFTINDMLWWLHCGVHFLYGTNSEKGAQMAGVAMVRHHNRDPKKPKALPMGLRLIIKRIWGNDIYQIQAVSLFETADERERISRITHQGNHVWDAVRAQARTRRQGTAAGLTDVVTPAGPAVAPTVMPPLPPRPEPLPTTGQSTTANPETALTTQGATTTENIDDGGVSLHPDKAGDAGREYFTISDSDDKCPVADTQIKTESGRTGELRHSISIDILSGEGGASAATTQSGQRVKTSVGGEQGAGTGAARK
ncbi:hypothetical protein ACQRIT_005784 [Beauveria bassiana]